jgi:CubicO group peptidase (beta-lactamase class C family)
MIKNSLIIVTLLIFSLLLSTCEKEDIKPPVVPLSCIKVQPFSDSVMQDWLDYYNIPGLCVAVIEYDTIDWVKGYGVLDSKNGGSIDEKTIFQAASISKPIAATITMNTCLKYDLVINEDINTYIKSWKIEENSFNRSVKTTISQILSHTGGINVSGFAGYDKNSEVPGLLEILNGNGLANNLPVKVEYTPASRYQYSGGGYQILQLLIEEKHNKKFGQVANEILFDPLNMNSSTYINPSDLNNTASGHSSNGKVVNEKWKVYPELCAAGLWTNVIDLSKFMIDFQKTNRGISNVVFTKDLTTSMLSPKIDIQDTKKSMGLGFVLDNDGSSDYFEHSGDNHGYKCYMMGYNDKPFGIIIMTNSANGNKIYKDVIDALFEVY